MDLSVDSFKESKKGISDVSSNWTPFGGILTQDSRRQIKQYDEKKLVSCDDPTVFKNMLIFLFSLEFEFKGRRTNRRNPYLTRIKGAVGEKGARLEKEEKLPGSPIEQFFRANEEEGLTYPDVAGIVKKREE